MKKRGKSIMKKINFVPLLLFVLITSAVAVSTQISSLSSQLSRSFLYDRDLTLADEFLRDFNRRATALTTQSSEANWQFETNLTNINLEKTVAFSEKVSEFMLEASENASKIKILDLPSGMQRQISIIRRNADSASQELRKEVRQLEAKMTSIFGKAKVRRSKKKGIKFLNLEPDLSKIMRKSRDPNELLFAWKGWRNAVGPATKPLYERSVDLLNIGAREHGWIDYGDFLRSEYEQGDDFELNLRRVWQSIKPLYEELHAYVRYRLKNFYNGKLNVSGTGMIPAHILGDMYAQNWENIFDIVKPFTNVQNLDATEMLKKKNYTAEKIFKLAESFFVSIGLNKLPESFWSKSVIKKIKGTEMVCHPSAWDFSSGDVRIKMCTEINQEHLITVHHEMGHVEYFLAYQNQPYAFRNGANPGFHEAIGDTISLSVETQTYLAQVGLLEQPQINDEESSITFLLKQALRRVAPIPYNYLVDKWRWRVFAGNITENNYNSEWWKLRTSYQGVHPPTQRKEGDFDPASKYHIGANVPYIPYFFSYVLQFQLHKALCREAGIKEPLHRCSIYQSKQAGAKFRTMLEEGRSKPWPKLLKAITGDRELSADAINQYFDPLLRWLVNYRKRHDYPVGWGEEDLSAKVLHRKAGKFESGQERSGILKTNNKGMSLSINIPSALTGGKSDATKNTDVEQKGEDDKISIPLIDLAKLLSSGDHFTVSSSETNANSKDGATSINNKEFNLSSDDDNSHDSQNSKNSQDTVKSQNKNGNETSNATPNSSGVNGQNGTNSANGTKGENVNSTAIATDGANLKGVNETTGKSNASNTNITLGNAPSEKQSDFVTNNDTATKNEETAANLVKNQQNNGTNATNLTEITGNNATAQQGQNATSSGNESSKPVNESLSWQAETLKNGLNEALANATNNTINEQGNSTTNATTRENAPCKRSSAGHDAGCNNDLMETVSVSPGELIQHVLMKKVKHLVEKTLPQANVEKTNNGFTVNFDLNPKDEIPERVSQSQAVTGKTRQQHVNVFIAPKGVVVKPKSSEQLMKPSFVPVQNKDNLELRGGK